MLPLLLPLLAAGAVGCGSCSEPTPSGPDAEVPDASAASADSGPPSRYCEGSVVRRLAGMVPDLGGGLTLQLQVASTATHDVVGGTFSRELPDELIHEVYVWAVRRADGDAQLIYQRDDAALAGITASNGQVTILAHHRTMVVPVYRARWDGVELRESISSTFPVSQRIVVRVEPDRDVLVELVHSPDGGGAGRLWRSDWPIGADVVRTELDPAVTVPGDLVVFQAVAAGEHVAVLLQPVGSLDGRLLWLDGDATRVEGTTVIEGYSAFRLVAMPDGSVVIATGENPGSRQPLLRAAFGDTEVSVAAYLRDGFEAFGAGTGTEGAFLATAVLRDFWGDPEEGRAQPLYLAHLPSDGSGLEDSHVPVLTGTCFAHMGMAGAPEGGAVLASSCREHHLIDLTYFCVPGVE